jgi:hypothetical protein
MRSTQEARACSGSTETEHALGLSFLEHAIALQVDDLLVSIDFTSKNRLLLHRCRMRLGAFARVK